MLVRYAKSKYISPARRLLRSRRWLNRRFRRRLLRTTQNLVVEPAKITPLLFGCGGPRAASGARPLVYGAGCQVISTRTGISFLTGMVRRVGGSMLKSARVAGMVPETRISFPGRVSSNGTWL
jgi:hypothetical protein